MGKCCIVSCKNRNDKKSPKKIMVFSFPKKEDIKNKWMEICSMVKLPKKAFVCADHFEEADYLPIPLYMQNWLDHGIYYSPKRRRIKDDAIPSKNLCPNVHLDSANDIIVTSAIIKEGNTKINNLVNIMENNNASKENVLRPKRIFAQEHLSHDSHECIKAEVVESFEDYDEIVSHERTMSPNRKSCEQNLGQSQLEQDKFISNECVKSSIINSSDEMDELKSKLQNLVKENMRLRTIEQKYNKLQSVHQKRRNAEYCLLKEIHTLKKNAKRLQSKSHTNKKIQDVLKNIFTPGQIHKIVHPERKYIHWDAESISRALTIHSLSRSAFKFLQQINFPLPSISCVKRWTSGITIKEEILEDVL